LPEIDGDHAAGAEAAGLHDLAREVENEAGLARQHEVAVVESLEARGAQAIAVEGGADDFAVGEHDRSGAVPRLEHAGVIAGRRRRASGVRTYLFPRHRHHHHRGL